LGVIVGGGISLWAARFVTTLLYGLQPRDPLTLAAAAAILGAIGALAGWIPARRASRIDPARVLREG
jgi:putative ABC transport system permease protein